MADNYYLGQIMLGGFGFAPKYFAMCSGQTLSIQQNTALFSLLGVTYGGNGTTNFQLPNLQGRTPIGGLNSTDPGWQPTPTALGQAAGTETVTLLTSQMPTHTHLVAANTIQTGGIKNPADCIYGGASEVLHAVPQGTVALNAAQVGMAGGNQPHENMQPFNVVNFCIAIAGIFPSRN